MDNSVKIAKNTIFLFLRMILVLMVSLYTSRVVLKVLGFEDFGIYNVVGSIVVFFAFLRSALTNATSRYITFEIGTGNKDNLVKVYSMAINCHIVLSIICLILLEIIGVWFLNNKLNIDPERMVAANWVFQLSILTFCVSIIQTPFYSNIIAHERMNFYAVVGIAEVILKLLLAYMLIIIPRDKLTAYAWLLLAVAIVVFLIYFIYCHRMFKDTKYIRYWDSIIVKSFASYSGWSMTVNAADVCSQQSISIFFNLFFGVIANTALGIVNQISSGLNSLVSSFTQAFNPQIIKSYAKNDMGYFMQLLFSSSKLTYILFCLFSVPLLANTDYVLSLWLGDYPSQTAIFFRMILIYYFIDSMQCPLAFAVYATGKLKTHHTIVGCFKILTIPLMYIVLKLGCEAYMALLIWSSMNIVCAIFRTIYMKSLINLPLKEYIIDVVARLSLFSIITIFPTLFLSSILGSTFFSFGITSLFSVISVLVIGFYIALNAKERNFVLSFVKSHFFSSPKYS